MIESRSINHIGMFTADAAQTAKWYCDNMGFEQAGKFVTSDGILAIFCRSNVLNITYEFIQHPKTDAFKSICVTTNYIDHIAYEVEDLDCAFEQAKNDGLDIIEGIIEIPEFWGNGFRYFLVRGFGGERVEFCKVL